LDSSRWQADSSVVKLIGCSMPLASRARFEPPMCTSPLKRRGGVGGELARDPARLMVQHLDLVGGELRAQVGDVLVFSPFWLALMSTNSDASCSRVSPR
jgi:hypothetical protein